MRLSPTTPTASLSAANYLTASGVTRGPQGVRRALWAYNHANWYVNDVLYYAKAYGGGTVLGDPTDCGAGSGDPDLPPLTDERVERMLSWSQEQLGEPYVFGANGPDAWDCSSFVQANYRQIGITVPRTAEAQRNWLANGNGFRIPEGQERPGDLVFTDTYRGPNLIGHVMVVLNPADGCLDRSPWLSGQVRQVQPVRRPQHLRDLATRQRRRPAIPGRELTKPIPASPLDSQRKGRPECRTLDEKTRTPGPGNFPPRSSAPS
ncbi:MAG: NlpC/P60 family protein [Nocardioidaceae bacterium]